MTSRSRSQVEKVPEPIEASPEIPDEALPSVETQQKAFELVRARAEALPADEVRRLNVESRLAYVNSLDGHAIMAPHLDKARRLPDTDAEAIELVPTFAAALLYTERVLSILVPKKRDYAQRMMRARQLRHFLLLQAEAAAVLGFVPEQAVERIRAGRGAIDTLEDLVALVALYRRHDEVLGGKTLATPELLDEAERLAADLQTELRPVTAKPKAKTIDEEIAKASDMRNRMWTLLHHGYSELQRVAIFYANEIGKVPSLQSRKALKKKASEAASA